MYFIALIIAISKSCELNVIVNVNTYFKLHADEIFFFKKNMLETEKKCSKVKNIVNIFNSVVYYAILIIHKNLIFFKDVVFSMNDALLFFTDLITFILVRLFFP